MLTCIVFDLGQVLIHWTPERFTRGFALPPGEEALLIRETFDGGEWDRLDEGTTTEAAAEQSICTRLPERLHPYVHRLVWGWWELALEPVEGMADLLAELKAGGYRLYLLSNAGLSLRGLLPRIPGAEYLTGAYLSAEHRLLKPHPEIYRDFLNTYGLTAESCFFVDDKEANIRGAAAVDIRGTVFIGDVSALRQALRSAGISCRA